MSNLIKEERIIKEYKRLDKIYSFLSGETRSINDGLIRRAAYMLVTLEDYEKDLDEGGYVESFQQSPSVPAYERKRPVAELYGTMNKNYQAIMKQLNDLMPKQDNIPKDDGFDDHLNSRDD